MSGEMKLVPGMEVVWPAERGDMRAVVVGPGWIRVGKEHRCVHVPEETDYYGILIEDPDTGWTTPLTAHRAWLTKTWAQLMKERADARALAVRTFREAVPFYVGLRVDDEWRCHVTIDVSPGDLAPLAKALRSYHMERRGAKEQATEKVTVAK